MQIVISIQLGAEFERMRSRLANFDSVLEEVLRATMAATILRAVQARFETRQAVIATYEENADSGNPDNLSAKAAAKLRDTRDALRQAAALRAGTFQEVMQLITDQRLIQISREPNSMTASIGNIGTLDKIESPSATPILTGKSSTSPYGILWRQMEWGTGALRKPAPFAVFPTRFTSSEGWWYGKKLPYRGIHFRGTQPGNFLRDATGLPYSQDAQQFRDLFSSTLRQSLLR